MDWNISPRSPVNDTVEINGHDSLIALLNKSMNYEHHTDYVPEPTPPYTDFDSETTPPYTDFDSETTPYCSKPIPIIDDDEEDDNNDYDDDVQYKGTKPSASSNLTPPMSKGKGKGKTNESKETKRTFIWLEYFRISKDVKTGNDVAECKKCKHVLSAKANAGTSHLKRHAEKHLKDMQNSTTQTQLSDSGFTSHRKIERSEIVRYIIHKGDSFSTPSHPAFVRLMRHANGHYDPHSRPTITWDSYKEFEKFRQPLIDELCTLKCKIALTSDAWTPRHNNEHGYVCITAHWIDDNWVLQKRIISFRTCEFPHTGSQLYLHIIGVLNDYNIVRKISTISFDNATNNTASVKLLLRHIKPPLICVFTIVLRYFLLRFRK
ncbi:hypothetical protein ABFX02_09G061000 [Erythranthe guttata]